MLHFNIIILIHHAASCFVVLYCVTRCYCAGPPLSSHGLWPRCAYCVCVCLYICGIILYMSVWNYVTILYIHYIILYICYVGIPSATLHHQRRSCQTSWETMTGSRCTTFMLYCNIIYIIYDIVMYILCYILCIRLHMYCIYVSYYIYHIIILYIYIYIGIT